MNEWVKDLQTESLICFSRHTKSEDIHKAQCKTLTRVVSYILDFLVVTQLAALIQVENMETENFLIY